MFEYKKLGKFTYNIIKDQKKIKPFLLKWLGKEWKIDYEEFPDQKWTTEWLEFLPKMDFALEIMDLEKIRLRQDLMNYKKVNYSFIAELSDRAQEREESMLRGVSIEPLVVNQKGFELMDGYTRYRVLEKHGEKQAYVYLGTTAD
jgi:hypothetical protein